jgi:hypothetical protein
MMKSLTCIAIAAACSAPPAVVLAQPGSSITREQVRSEIIDLQKVGYSPGTASDNDFPGNIQAAEARLAALRATTQKSTSGGYGPAIGGSEKSGTRGLPATQ